MKRTIFALALLLGALGWNFPAFAYRNAPPGCVITSTGCQVNGVLSSPGGQAFGGTATGIVSGANGLKINLDTGVITGTNPVFTTPNLGTPSAVNLANGTNLPAATALSGIVPLGNLPTIPASQTSGLLPLTGGTLSGSLTAPSFNATGTGGYQIGGSTILQIGSSAQNPAIFIGPGAGASFPLSTGLYPVGIGVDALQALTAPSSEDTCVGTLSCYSVTTGANVTADGMHAVGQETVSNNIFAGGTDSFRNSIGSHDSVGIGTSTQRDGAQPYNVAMGTSTLQGNASTLTIGGTATAADTIAVTISSAASSPPSGVPITTTPCTITSGESTASMATCLMNAINAVASSIGADGVFLSAYQSSVSGGPTNIISVDFPGSNTTGWDLTFTPVITGAATETITVTTGSVTGNTVALGFETATGVYAGSPNNNTNLVAIGSNVMPWFTTANTGVAIGASAGHNIGTDKQFVILGTNAGFSETSATNSTFVGYEAGFGVTTGGQNTVIGAKDDSTSRSSITTGSQNIEIGYDTMVPSATSSYQLDIQNAIYGSGNSGKDTTISTGCLEFYGTSCQNGTVGSAVELAVTVPSSGAALSLANTAGTCIHTPGSSSETVTCTSDRKFKTDIHAAWWHDFEAGWLWTFQVDDYVWRATGKHVVGVVAQQMERSHPDMVHRETAPDGSTYLAVDEPNPWQLVLAIQELQAFAVFVCLVALLSWTWHLWHWHRHHRGRRSLEARIAALEAERVG